MSHTRPIPPFRARPLRALVLAACAWLWVGAATAQEETADLPRVDDVARVLADPAERIDALLTLSALTRLNLRLQSAPAADIDAMLQDLRSDLGWLAALAARYGAPYPRSPVLDPAAWRVELELELQGLLDGRLLVAPGPGLDISVGQVFNRGNTRLAAAMLPKLMWHLETQAPRVWSDLLEQVSTDERLAGALAGMRSELFTDWVPPGEEAPARPDADGVLEDAFASLDALALQVIAIGPPDPRRLRSIRRSLLAALPGMDGAQRAQADAILLMAGLLDGLHEFRYFHFAEGMLAVMAGLMDAGAEHGPAVQRLASWLTGILPGISNSYARAWSGVDPRLNSALAAAFDTARTLSRGGDDTVTASTIRQIGDAVAQLALLVPDMAYYFELPVRDPVAGGVDACRGLVAQRDPDGSPAMTRELFDDCQGLLLTLAGVQAREAQLAGDTDGPFGNLQLQRELSLTSGQRINYGIGYLHERYSTGCREPTQPLPNPLEWAYLATFMAWFSEQGPVYFQTPENERRLGSMRDIGGELMRVVAEQVDCISGAGAGINDPVFRVTADYREALGDLGLGLRTAQEEFRARRLEPGADVALDRGARQPTAYRPANLQIGPCDPQRVCEMSGPLSSTRALLGLFPDEYLIADQTRLGDVEICYDNMEWVQRRSEPVRAGDRNVANYYGHLAFDLRGRYVEEGESVDLFAFRFASPEEHHYMFAAQSEEILADSCPVEWIGTRVVTELPEGRPRIVPNRLTYLSAPRTLPSRLLARNWDRGAEWRDWFVTGIGVRDLQVEERRGVTERVNQHLQTLYRRQQRALYSALLQSSGNAAGRAMGTLFENMRRVDTSKTLMRMQMMLFYPQILNGSDDVRSAIAGHGGLLDFMVLTRFREENVPVSEVAAIAFNRLNEFQEDWRAVPEAVRRGGSVADSLSHALARLNALHASTFAAPVRDAQPPPGSGPPAPEGLDESGQAGATQ